MVYSIEVYFQEERCTTYTLASDLSQANNTMRLQILHSKGKLNEQLYTWMKAAVEDESCTDECRSKVR
jgi:hypothetical protein